MKIRGATVPVFEGVAHRLVFGLQLWHGEGVSDAAAIAQGKSAIPAGTNPAARFMFEWIERWVKLCDDFVEWQYREIVAGHPTAELLVEHRDGLKWMLRTTRTMQVIVKDPEFPLRQFANEVDGRLIQFEHMWRLIHDRMPDAEAEQLLKEVFPT